MQFALVRVLFFVPLSFPISLMLRYLRIRSIRDWSSAMSPSWLVDGLA